MNPVPYAVFEAAVSVAGTALHWKTSLRQLLRNAGVSEAAWARYQDESKFKIMRGIWSDLDAAGSDGRKIQHAIVQQLASLNEPDPKAPDIQAGRDAID